MLNSEKIEKDLVELLAIIYNRVPWGKMNTRHNTHDIFNHRVRAASRRENLFQFVSKLCNYFGLQSLPADSIPVIERLRQNEEYVLNKVYDEHIPLCVMAFVRAKELKKIKNKNQLTFNLEELKND